MKIIQIVSHDGKLIALTDSGQLFERVPYTASYSGYHQNNFAWTAITIPLECEVVTTIKSEQPKQYEY